MELAGRSSAPWAIVLAAAAGSAAIAWGQCDPAQQAKLIGSDTFGDDQAGTSSAISGGTALVGAPYHRVSGVVAAGSVFVFVSGPTGWVQEAELISPDPGVAEYFGWSVAIEGDTAVIGSMGDDHSGKDGAGCAYVFTRSEGLWTYRAKLTAPDPESADYFGCSVGLSGGTIVAGAFQAGYQNEGAAFIFEGGGELWTMRAKLIETSGQWVSWFGQSVAIDGDTIAVGCPRVTDWPEDLGGLACVYRRGPGGWAHEVTLTASDAAGYDEFGWSAAVSGDTVVIGARYADNGIATSDLGSAYAFRRTAGGWVQEAKLYDPAGNGQAHLGWSVAIDGDVAVAGAPGQWHGGTGKSGSASVFSRSGGVWTLAPRVYALDWQPSDEFGYSAGISGNLAVVGARYDTHVPYVGDSGSAYIFGLNCACPADLTGDGLVDFTDYLEFLNLYDAGDPRADLNGDGFVDFSDYLAFLNFYDVGC